MNRLCYGHLFIMWCGLYVDKVFGVYDTIYLTQYMSSVNATNVAKEVLDNIGKGKKVKLGEIILKNGYKKNTADNPLLVTSTKSYMAVINPTIKRMETTRDKMLKALGEKDMSKEKMSALVTALDVLTKNIQLLGGKATDNIALNITISEAIAGKHAVVAPDKDTTPNDSQG